VLEQDHPIEPQLFSTRTINYTQNANPITDCGVYNMVFTLAIVAVQTCTPESQSMTTINLINERHFLTATRVVCTKAGHW